MYTIQKAFIICAVLLISAISGNCQSASANISATIVTPITIAKNQDISFGNFSAPDRIGGHVILTPAGTRYSSVTSIIKGNSGVVTAADFTVMGNIGLTFGIQLPTSILLKHSGGLETMTAAAFTSTPSEDGFLAGGIQHIQIGATLTVTPGQLPGMYTSSEFEVVVNYN